MERTQRNTANPTGSPLPANAIKIALLVAFVIAAAITAYLTFITARDLVTSWELTSLPGIKVSPSQQQVSASGETIPRDASTPLQPVGGPPPPAWDGAKRVNLLIMGLDYRDWATGEGPPRTDTMILLTIDPVNRTAGMVSIPRDLWVNVPGYGYNRINAAYRLGELYSDPSGGGPGLAMKTVEQFLGVPIDYYAQIDFSAFVRFIDELGGVKLDIAEEIKVDPIGGEVKTLKPGRQTLPGDLALAYARARKNAGDDFGRAARQQQVILGIRNRVIAFDMLPTLIAKSGILYSELSSGVHTNLSLNDAVKLAWLGSQIPDESIKKGIIAPPDMVSFAVSPDGEQQVLKPITEKIRELRDQIFTDSGPASPLAPSTMDQAGVVQAENARVSVLNGTAAAGLASSTTDFLKSKGVNVTVTGNAQRSASATEITFYTGKPYTVKFLADLMKVNPIHIHYREDPASPVDVVVVVGDDWAASNPMGQ